MREGEALGGGGRGRGESKYASIWGDKTRYLFALATFLNTHIAYPWWSNGGITHKLQIPSLWGRVFAVRARIRALQAPHQVAVQLAPPTPTALG
jgi:hypothetical protein